VTPIILLTPTADGVVVEVSVPADAPPGPELGGVSFKLSYKEAIALADRIRKAASDADMLKVRAALSVTP
jgi:hypothetical protein